MTSSPVICKRLSTTVCTGRDVSGILKWDTNSVVSTTSIMATKIQPVTPPRKRGSYRRHGTEFKREVVARSLMEGTSVSRLAREFNINANQVFTWRKQFATPQGVMNAGPAVLMPVTVLNSSDVASAPSLPPSGEILLTVGRAHLRIAGGVDAAALAQVLARLLP